MGKKPRAEAGGSREQEPDRVLVDRIRRHGDEDAFRQLYRRHSPRLYRFLLRYTGGHETEAEDALQESWIRTSRRLDKLREPDQFYSWLRSTAVFVLRESARREARRHRLSAASFTVNASEREESGIVNAAGNADAAAAHAEALDLERAIAALAAEQRRVLVLHDVEGFTHQEIGRMLGIPEGTSKSQLWAARKKVRALLQPAGVEEAEDVTTER